MHPYILESLAMVGCGAGDARELAAICEGLPSIAWDTLDAMHNFGPHTTLTPAGSAARADLTSEYSDDDLICLAAYVNAYRNVN